MSFLLAQEGQTAEIVIEDLKFEIKVMTYEERMKWAADNDKTEGWDELKKSLCNVIVSVQGFNSPDEFLSKIVTANDLNKIIIALATAAGLDEDIGKNLEGLSEPSNSTNTNPAIAIVEKENETVLTTGKD